MPYKIDTDRKLLPKKLDRRIKLTDSDKIEIKYLIKHTELSNDKIGDMFGVNRKSIWLIRNPIQAQKERDAYKLRRADGRYYNKDKHIKAVRDTRRYRQKNKDLLLDNNLGNT